MSEEDWVWSADQKWARSEDAEGQHLDLIYQQMVVDREIRRWWVMGDEEKKHD